MGGKSKLDKNIEKKMNIVKKVTVLTNWITIFASHSRISSCPPILITAYFLFVYSVLMAISHSN